MMRTSTRPELPAGAIPVTNCDDSGPGSLRDAVLSAASGQTIDLTNTGCSVITLTTGAIGIGQASLTLQGPSSDFVEISGNNAYQVLFHTGTGTLTVDHLALSAGRKYQTGAQLTAARGGCAFSAGTLYISNSAVKYCEAKDTSSTYGAKGGALYATTGIVVSYSEVFDNDAYSTAAYSRGGGIYTPGTLMLNHAVISGNESKSLASNARATGGGVESIGGTLSKYSTIDGNSAYGPNFASIGGGFYGAGAVTIENSTVSNNSAEEGGGVLLATSSPSTILSSTISGNSATVHAGICVFFDAAMKIENSTIALNGSPALFLDGDGVYAYQATVDLESTIISDNSNNGFPDDVTTANGGAFTGANNLIYQPWATVPSDTIEGLHPGLFPLADNGGATETHALSFDSPAIDMGNDNAAVSYDQRGSGYARTIGANVDIGAFEVDTTDRIFANGFD
ncbi:MAG TPA: right-handed parallel beta-helix repeat-containing protein [Rhodanobacteraceae bacterium]|nr:right-handed parallel beta-helix repeat-containing protein [Rhodanobacteraceae bacterium]